MATITSAASGAWSAGATWVGGVKPADNDAVVIAAGHSVLMDEDTSAFTGLQTVTIQGHATTPAMLYFAAGSSGYLKIRTNYSLVGTSGAEKGRLLANSDGAWANTGELPFADKAVIDLGAVSQINAQYLDVRLYGYNSMADKWLRLYGARHTVTVDASADTLTKAAHGLTNGTVLGVRSSGALPAPLDADGQYYVVNATANTLQLAATSGGTALDLTTTGSGTVEVYTGAASGLSTVNVFEDVTTEIGWTTASGHNRACMVNIGPQSYDQQRVTISAITASTVTLSAATDSTQLPGARLVLAARNVSIRCATTSSSYPIVDYVSNPDGAGVFRCELVATTGTGTTFYGLGIRYGTGHTVSGTVMGCSYGIGYGTGHTVSGTVMGCNYGAFASTVTFTGKCGFTIAGDRLPNLYDIRFNSDGATRVVFRGSATYALPPSFAGLNNALITYGNQGAYCEDYNRTPGDSRAYTIFGDVIRNTAVTRAGGAASSIEVAPLSNCGPSREITVLEWTEASVPASAQTRQVYVLGEGWTTWPTAAELFFEAEYVSDAGTLATTTVRSTAVLTDNTTWTALAVSFTPSAACHVRYRAVLGKYEASSKIYVDNQLS